MKYTTFVGLDVHKNSISVAVAYNNSAEPEYWGAIPNSPDAILKLLKKFKNLESVIFCYEAGPCGYNLYHQIIASGAACFVVAPSLIPTKPGDRVKTDSRDCKKLARLLRNDDLTPVWVPSKTQEALRDILRARQDAVKDHTRKRNQLTKFLLRLGLIPPQGVNLWTLKHRQWLEKIQLEQHFHQICLWEHIRSIDEAKAKIVRLEKEILPAVEKVVDRDLIYALQALRGVSLITAATLIAEVGDFNRFNNPQQLMSYAGLVPSEHSSGSSRHQGKITKAGNSVIRYVVVESSWHYRFEPKIGRDLKKRQTCLTPEVRAIAWKAQHRLNHKYRLLLAKGKPKQKAITAIGRELLGFIWAIAKQINVESKTSKVA
jgi:transposase